jgi:Rer1 family
VDPDNDGPGLPTADTDEFRPFTRRLPEFQFWHSSVRGVLIAFCMTFFGLFDVPVFWPILLVYFLVLFFLTMKRQIKHMIKHRCVAYICIYVYCDTAIC